MGDILKLRIQLRRDTVANWEKYNPMLLSGEIAVSSDLNQFKIGDGIHNWADLEYVAGDGLTGFTQAPAGSYPVKQDDGTLKWVQPSAFTAEGVQQELTQLNNKVTELPKAISIGGEQIDSVNGVVDIPIATTVKCGLVKGSDEISISDNGTLNIQTVDVVKLTQTDNLILYGGDAQTV